uniref:EB1 C-terminal domain-containing protein n=1 Tax=Hymenolepis diminuta TaxID=6216 RepID=A0A0R3SKW8_HYMDI
LWRIREIELSSQIAELRQHFSELDCLHDVENASNTLQSPPSRRNLDESLPLSAASSAAPTPAEVRRHPSTRVPSMTVESERFSSMWKDLPPAIMTDSIGPLEDLCIIPDDPLITSIYVQENASKQVGEV